MASKPSSVRTITASEPKVIIKTNSNHLYFDAISSAAVSASNSQPVKYPVKYPTSSPLSTLLHPV